MTDVAQIDTSMATECPTTAGAPANNKNGIRHGLLAGSLPSGCEWVKRAISKLRALIESQVIEAKGEVSLVDAAIILTAVRWERHALLAQRWLRERSDRMDDKTRLAYSRDVAMASAQRDKAIAQLGIGRKSKQDEWQTLYATPFNAIENPTASDQQDGTKDAS